MGLCRDVVHLSNHNEIKVEELELIIDLLESRIRKGEPTVQQIRIEVDALKRSSNPAPNAAETWTGA
jgi:hypothetical protein